MYSPEQICDAVKNLEKNLIELKKTPNLPYNATHTGYTLKQAIDIIEEIIILLKQACEDKLIEVIGINNIKPIIDNLNLLNSNLQRKDYTNIISAIVILYPLIKYLNLDLYLKNIPVYQKKLKQLEELRNQYEETLKTLKSSEEEYKKHLKTLESALPQVEKIEKIYEEIDELNDKRELFLKNSDFIEETKNEINLLKQKISSEKEELIKTKTEIEKLREELELLLEESTTDFSKLKEDYETSMKEKSAELEKLINKAKQTLEWTEASALKTAFEKRAKKLEEEASKRYKHFIRASLAITAIALVVIFGGEFLFNENSWLFTIARITILIPAFFVGYGLWRSWQQTKLLADEYNNKKILAENLMIGANTLKERLEVDGDETKEKFLHPTIVKLLEDPIEKIYKLSIESERNSLLKKFLPLKKGMKDIEKNDED
ncbi:hypothetical protein GWK41_10065 [Persephonella atlantica]|uniref:Uncharacterized protein n=1 Tax=Persephonella atlantica TaxID=2699429 RepID=A0ABS1GKE8_9AQUI|nr:hypothetical protein [Persephonella atlantica]MBK3333408.1 hypothetical protein [Persephonella atlantica]